MPKKIVKDKIVLNRKQGKFLRDLLGYHEKIKGKIKLYLCETWTVKKPSVMRELLALDLIKVFDHEAAGSVHYAVMQITPKGVDIARKIDNNGCQEKE